MILEAAEKICENEDTIETKSDIMSMPVYIENKPMTIDEVIGEGYIKLFYTYIFYSKLMVFYGYSSSNESRT
jgi:hypothetical protein